MATLMVVAGNYRQKESDKTSQGKRYKMTIVIGLTGGIASGKSTVSQMFSELGAAVIDADKITHEVYQPHTEAWREVVAAFGKGILHPNEEIDRGKLGKIVFGNPEALEQLNRIVHPIIASTISQRIEDLRRQGSEVVVLEAAILIEAKWTDGMDQIWVTTAPENTVIRRLGSQKGFTEEEAKARINAQMPIAEKAKLADVVIDTDCDLSSVREQVNSLWQNLLASKI